MKRIIQWLRDLLFPWPIPLHDGRSFRIDELFATGYDLKCSQCGKKVTLRDGRFGLDTSETIGWEFTTEHDWRCPEHKVTK